MADKDIAINLLGEEEMDHSPLGRIVTWAVTYGRYIMIGTEIVVLLAFISRFSLDRKLTDLNEEIAQKQAIIEANTDFEQQFRTVQTQLEKIQALLKQPDTVVDALSSVQSVLPTQSHLTSLNIQSNKMIADAVANTSGDFSSLVYALQNSATLHAVDIGDVNRDPLNGIQFEFTAALGSLVKTN